MVGLSVTVFASEELDKLIADSQTSITARLNRGETVIINNTELRKVNGVVYGVGLYSEAEKAEFEAARIKRGEERAAQIALERSRSHQLEVERIRADARR